MCQRSCSKGVQQRFDQVTVAKEAICASLRFFQRYIKPGGRVVDIASTEATSSATSKPRTAATDIREMGDSLPKDVHFVVSGLDLARVMP